MKKLKYPIIQGETISWPCTKTGLPAGTWAVTSQVRDKSGNLLADFVITPPSIVSTAESDVIPFVMSIDETVTQSLPVTTPTSLLYMDIFYRYNSFNIADGQVCFDVIDNITAVPA